MAAPASDKQGEDNKEASDTTANEDGSRRSFGLTAVWIGVIGIIVALTVGVLAVYVAGDKAGDVATVASPAIAAISSITAAYFGIKLGQEGTKEATDTAKEANKAAADAATKVGDAVAHASATKGVALTHAKMLKVARSLKAVRGPRPPSGAGATCLLQCAASNSRRG